MLRTRTFDTITLLFTSENHAIDVFDTVKELTVASACPFETQHHHSNAWRSLRVAALRFLLRSQPSICCEYRMVALFSEGRIWTNGSRFADEGMEIHGYQQRLLGASPCYKLSHLFIYNG